MSTVRNVWKPFPSCFSIQAPNLGRKVWGVKIGIVTPLALRLRLDFLFAKLGTGTTTTTRYLGH